MVAFLAKLKKDNIFFFDFGSDFNFSRFKQFVKDNDGKNVRIELAKKAVSDELRGYYYAVVVPTARATILEWQHYSDEKTHEMLKTVFNGFKFFNPVTKKTETAGLTAVSNESNTQRAMAYIEKIRLYLAENYFVELPNPDEYQKELDKAKLR